MTLVTLFSSVAQATAGDCSATESFSSRALFANTGAYTTIGPAGVTVVDCSLGNSFYGEVLAITPFQQFDTGKEIDFKLGWRTNLGAWGVDAFLASYSYSFGTGHSSDLDGRVKVSYKVEASSMFTFLPYVGADHTRSLSNGTSDNSVFAGAIWQIKLTEQLGWDTDVALWHHFDAALGFNPNVWSVTTGPSMQIDDKWSLNLGYTHTWGGVEAQGHEKSSFRGGFTFKF